MVTPRAALIISKTEKSNPQPWILYATALFSNILWSFSYGLQKTASYSMDLATINAWRFLIGAGGIFLIIKLRRLKLHCPTKMIPGLLVVGIICYCLAPLIQIYAIKNTRAINAAILVATEPIFATIVAVIFLGEKLTKKDYGSYLIIIIGVAILSGLQLDFNILPSGELSFNLLILCGIFLEAISTPIVKYLVSFAHAFTLAFYSYLIAAIAQFMVGLVNGSQLLPPNNMTEFLPVILLGIFCTTIAYSLWYWVANYLDVHKMCLFIFFQPVSAAIFSWLMLGEVLQNRDIIGSMVIFSGVLLVSTNTKSSAN